MEVHHHPDLHHKRKRFKEYFLEFLMIFLAVTLGFFAESIRENINDRNKEKEFIVSMIGDASTDTANINGAILLNTKRALQLDSLAQVCYNYNSVSDDSNIYRLYRRAIVHPDFVTITERTLSQLKNSGAMRLIRKTKAVDSIILYDDFSKKLYDQQAYYEKYQNESLNSAFELLNFQYFPIQHKSQGYSSARLLNSDKIKIIEFGNRIAIYAGVVNFYVVRLEEAKLHAVNLIATLKKEYDIDDK